VKLHKGFEKTEDFIEVIGVVERVDRMKMLAYVNLGNELDLDVVNNVVEFSHDEKFRQMFQ